MNTCSFCKFKQSQVGKLVAGPDKLFICSNCIELASSIVEDEKPRVEEPKPTPKQQLSEKLNATLLELHETQGQLNYSDAAVRREFQADLDWARDRVLRMIEKLEASK